MGVSTCRGGAVRRFAGSPAFAAAYGGSCVAIAS